MNNYFIDTSFIIALINQKDNYHKWALNLSDILEDNTFVTSDLILFEIANYLAKDFRIEAKEVILSFLESDNIEIIWHNEQLFQESFKKYSQFNDKSWGLVDCLSFVIMEKYNIEIALSIDHHFEQAGFVLIK